MTLINSFVTNVYLSAAPQFVSIQSYIFCEQWEIYKKYSFLVKPRLNHHRHNYSDPDASHKPTQAGTKAFIDVLKSRSFLKYIC